MNYEQAVAYIEETPKFTKKNSLDHTKECLARLGNPQNHFKVIHVAGTNGKGSTCAFLTSILREAGYSCGLFTSPHLVEINERFQINEVNIDNDTFLAAFQKVKALADELVAMNIDDDIGSITFVGLCTDICVISNALLVKAALPEVPIIVDAACCAGVTPESHENALKAMKMCQIDIVG